MMSKDISKRKEIAISACKEVGKILLNNFGKELSIQSKGDRDLVTHIDKKSEEAIIKSIKRNFPGDRILSEEIPGISSASGFTSFLHSRPGEYIWIIDPVDGTHNFIHNIEIFGTSIALVSEGEVVLGTIYMPTTDELYIARKGKGAYCNNKRINVSKRKIRETTLVYDSSIRLDKKKMLEGLGELVDKIFNVRMFGSTVRSLTYVAEGKVEAEIEFNDKIWDFAAGLLLVEEAGGCATDFQGRRWSINTSEYIASNGVVHQEILKTLKRGGKK